MHADRQMHLAMWAVSEDVGVAASNGFRRPLRHGWVTLAPRIARAMESTAGGADQLVAREAPRISWLGLGLHSHDVEESEMSTQLGSRPALPKPSSPSRRVAAAPRSRRAPIPAGHLARQAGKVAPAEASDFVVDSHLGASEVRGG